MKIVADKNMPLAREAFAPLCDELVLIEGRKISRDDVRDADALITRSTTKINAALLEGSRVRFYGSAVSGEDHIDADFLQRAGITFSTAAGCNSMSVVRHVERVLDRIGAREGTLGIIGVGRIGSKVWTMAESRGLRVMGCDIEKYYSKEEVLRAADFVTLHVPLTYEGAYATYHFIGTRELALMKDGAWLINAARGAAVDSAALLAENRLHYAIDTWENEPNIDPALLARVEIATPHIAGYALEGKINGTMMIRDALRRFLGRGDELPILGEVRDFDKIRNSI